MDICNSEDEARVKAANLKSDKYPVFFFQSDSNGEKLFEEFYTDEEELLMDKFEVLGVIKNAARRTRSELDTIINDIEDMFNHDVNKADVVKLLNKLLPNFQHIETGVNLDQKM